MSNKNVFRFAEASGIAFLVYVAICLGLEAGLGRPPAIREFTAVLLFSVALGVMGSKRHHG